MKVISVFLLLTILFLMVVPASAQNMSISNLGLGGDEDVLIYAIDATNESQMLIGLYNTSSVHIPLPDSDFQLVIKPSALRNAFDPLTFLNDSFVFVQNNIIAILLIVFLAALWLGRK